MKNKISYTELINGLFIFLFGVQIISLSNFWIIPINTKILFGHASYILGSLLIIQSIFIIKLNIYNKTSRIHAVDYAGFAIGLFVLIDGAYIIQSGWLHSRGAVFYLVHEEKYFAGAVLLFSGIYMVSRSYVLKRKHAR